MYSIGIGTAGALGAYAPPSFHKLLYELLTTLCVVSNCAPAIIKSFLRHCIGNGWMVFVCIGEPHRTFKSQGFAHGHWLFSHRVYICLQWEWAVVSGYCIAECLLHLLLFHPTHSQAIQHTSSTCYTLITHSAYFINMLYTLTNCSVFVSWQRLITTK